MNMGAGIEIGNSFFVPFSENDDVIFVKGNVGTVELQ
jgi:hypothetical protein